MRKVTTDCLVSYEANLYSVPWKYTRQTVDIQDHSDGCLYIYYRGTLIAQHRKSDGKHQINMVKEHYQGILPKAEKNDPVATLHQPEVQVRSLQEYESLVSGGNYHG